MLAELAVMVLLVVELSVGGTTKYNMHVLLSLESVIDTVNS